MLRQYRVIQGWSLAAVKAARPGRLCEANVILLCVFGVRHVLLHSPPPPPRLVLHTDNSPSSPLFHTSSTIYSQQIVPPATGTVRGIVPLHNMACCYLPSKSSYHNSQVYSSFESTLQEKRPHVVLDLFTSAVDIYWKNYSISHSTKERQRARHSL